jgi:hypothetical protein
MKAKTLARQRAGNAHFYTGVRGTTDLLLCPPVPGPISFGAPLRVSAALGAFSGESSTGPRSAAIEAEIQRPDGTTTTIGSYDDGYHRDGWADDGGYTSSLLETTQAGRYSVFLRADGMTTSGPPFRRLARSEFRIGSETDRIVDVVEDELIDADLDGSADYLRFRCLASVATSGTYSMAGSIGSVLTSRTVSASALAEALPVGENAMHLLSDLRQHDGTSRRMGGSFSSPGR